MLTARFLDRSGNRLIQPSGRMVVNSISRTAIGTYKRAKATFSGDLYTVQNLGTYLGYYLKVHDHEGRTVWVGRITEMVLHLGTRTVSVAFRDMWNSIAVVYQSLAAGSATTGVSTTTAAATNTTSTAAYGTKELYVQGSNLYTSAAAEQKRDQALAYYAFPRVTRDSRRGGPIYADIYADGAFQLLDWTYYANAGTDNTETTTQISEIITAEGQFLTSTRIVTASGISTNEYRDGELRASDEIMQLLEIGTSNDRRLLASVDQFNRVAIYEEPARGTADWSIDSEGQVRDEYGNLMPRWTAPGEGHWILDSRGLVTSLDSVVLADPAAFFCETSEYNQDSGTLTLTPRGTYSPMDFVRLGIG